MLIGCILGIGVMMVSLSETYNPSLIIRKSIRWIPVEEYSTKIPDQYSSTVKVIKNEEKSEKPSQWNGN